MNIRTHRLRNPSRLTTLPPTLIALLPATWLAACQILSVAAGIGAGCAADASEPLSLFAWMLHLALLPRSNICAITGTILAQSGKTTDTPLSVLPDEEYGGPRMTR